MSNPRSGKKFKKLFVKTVKTAWICTDMQTFGKKTGEVGSYNGCQYFCQNGSHFKIQDDGNDNSKKIR